MKDREVIAKIKQGDQSALDYIYQKNYRTIVRMILNNNGSEDEAKDIFQDAAIVFWQKASSPDFELTSKISTYLYAICKNLWYKELERKSRLSNSVVDKETEVMENLEKEEKLAIIHKCIAQLGKTCQKVLTYHYFDGLSMQDIAERMGFANADTAKTTKYKCKKQLDKLIKSKYKATDFLD